MNSRFWSVTVALVNDTFREAFSRKIFWGFLACSTLLILFFLFILRVDVVQGALNIRDSNALGLGCNHGRENDGQIGVGAGERPELVADHNGVKPVL